ncbi:MAG: ABC transporter substrate-binding protein [Motilibacteraceae bacterium]
MTIAPKLAALAAGAALLLSACGGSGSSAAASKALDPADWSSVLAAAKGQTVNWYMYGGDDNLNGYVNGYVKKKAAEAGVTLNEVKINDTVEAVNKVLGEKQAGKTSGGSVDLIWINGENFATGKQADLWYCGYPQKVPNATYYDFGDPSLSTDFGVPVDDCEAPWNRAQSVLVYDSAKVKADDVDTVDKLTTWVAAHPGKFTYPAPPDFTGSMAVRTFAYNAAGGYQNIPAYSQQSYDQLAPKVWSELNGLEKNLWRGGSTYPKDQPSVTKLYGDGEIDAFLSYDSGSISAQVDKGAFPATTRELVFEEGTIGNVNYVSIPKNAGHLAGAMVVANILMSPDAQYEKLANPPGYYPALDVDKLDATDKQKFTSLKTPESQLPFSEQTKNANPELPKAWLEALEKGWTAEVEQK